MKYWGFKLMLIALMSLFTSGCTKYVNEPKTEYFIISPGCHYAYPGCKDDLLDELMNYEAVRVDGIDFMERKFKFDDTAVYTNSEQDDINKLFGFTDCGHQYGANFDPLNNSARIGWRWYKNKLELHAFVHVHHVFTSKFLGEIKPWEDGTARISIEKNSSTGHYQYRFKYGSNPEVVMPRGCDEEKIKGWQLRPYFGGNLEAPQMIRITLY